MYLFVGLGNPGPKYEDTPHNAGFLFVNMAREYFGWDSLYTAGDWKYDKLFESELSDIRNGAKPKIKLVKPHTFMNLSGRAVKKLCSKFEIPSDTRLVLIHDDLDIKLGRYKIQKGIGPKKHNGVDSVQTMLGRTDFLRVRIGVENRTKENRIPGEDYVLKMYSDEENTLLKEACSEAFKDLRSLIQV